MAEITVPDQHLIVDKEWILDQPAQVNRSAWTGRAKIVGMPGASLWTVKASIRIRTKESAKRPWRAFLLSLRGPVNTFKLYAACSQRTGSNPTVAAGAAIGWTLPLTGLPVSQTVLKAGQFMTVTLPSGFKALVCLNADLVSNGSGTATASFEPALNEIAANGAAVETINPYCLMRLRSIAQGWSEAGGVQSMTFEAEEAK